MAALFPYARYLGLGARLDEAGLVTVLRHDPTHIGNPVLPALHGGVVGAALETAALFHLMWAGDSARLPKIVTITFEYLRSARPRDLFARAEVTKQGRRVAHVSVAAWQDEPARPVAAAHGVFLLT
ncbi:MAG: PaaI family thioesterase [Alphaproteobacteria bacterium]|nr:PaaI family thioesterase [Alphaproteobacteria bacterium]